MATSTPNVFQRHWALLLSIVLISLAGLMLVTCTRIKSIDTILGGQDQPPAPPPPSEAMPDAPGPDNTVQSLPPDPNRAPQPPSPIRSQTDPSRKPKEKGDE